MVNPTDVYDDDGAITDDDIYDDVYGDDDVYAYDDWDGGHYDDDPSPYDGTYSEM